MNINAKKVEIYESETTFRFEIEEINISFDVADLEQLTGSQCPAKQRGFSIVDLSGSEIGKKAAEFLKNFIDKNHDLKGPVDPDTLKKAQDIVNEVLNNDAENNQESSN